ncbi:intraflagellar transport protein 74 [Trichonephila inaurata madagascariensis]|uniref:Intraflagellar transport protein 74 n=1 Tax=Trichonephila inaurata madagascariensis TaxID=2747483 RepID=A0A8X6YDK6_9ARAC|nr:intraflagellar transport protein 74 [Trichonephila inaurata madagascariensis]
METSLLSSRTKRRGLTETALSEMKFYIQNNTAHNKRFTPFTEKSSRSSSDAVIHTPLFNKSLHDHHLSDQGLDVTRHRSRLENRQIRDKSYYKGVLYHKGYEIGSEIKNLWKQIDLMGTEKSSYFSYKQKAEKQASELKDLQGILLDYNLVDDWYATEVEISEIGEELQRIKAANQVESAEVEKIFEERKKKESLIVELETDISQERYVTDILSSTSSPHFRDRYKCLRKEDEDLKSVLRKLEEEFRSLESQRKSLEEKCKSVNKLEAYSLLRKLSEEQKKRDNLFNEQCGNDSSSEMSKLQLRKREHYDLFRSISSQTRIVKSQINQKQNQLQNIHKESNDIQTERIQKLSKLKNRESIIDAFLASFPEKQSKLFNQLTDSKNRIKELLELMSSQLNFDELGGHSKEIEMQNIEERKARDSLKQELLELMAKEALEDKLLEEVLKLKDDFETKNKEIDQFSNTELLEAQFETKKKDLLAEAENYRKQRDAFKFILQDLQKKCNTLEETLQKNEVNKELLKLETQWQYLEQNNFAMEKYLTEAKTRGDYFPVKKSAMDTLRHINKMRTLM